MITAKQRALEEERRRSVVRVVQRVQECMATGTPVTAPEILARHPLAALIQRVALREGPGSRAVVVAANEILTARAERDGQRMREGKVIGLQSNFVLPVRETRDAALGLATVAETDLEAALDGFASRFADVMPAWWFPYVSIASSYTVVTINGRAAPARFSGTYSDAFGAVHGVMPGNVEIYMEVLTHEAGHLWLNLVADQDATFIRNPYAQQCFVSPWRNDARPIHGIFHGAYVFSVVIPALVAMRTETAKARAVQLAVEVKDGLRQVLAFGSLSPEALEIAVSAEARVKEFEQELGAGALALAGEMYAKDKESKVRRLKSVQSDLEVT